MLSAHFIFTKNLAKFLGNAHIRVNITETQISFLTAASKKPRKTVNPSSIAPTISNKSLVPKKTPAPTNPSSQGKKRL